MVQIHISSVFDRYPSFGSLLDRFEHFWKKQAKGHVSLLPGLVLLVVLAVHSALACHSVVRTASDKYWWNRHTRPLMLIFNIIIIVIIIIIYCWLFLGHPVYRVLFITAPPLFRTKMKISHGTPALIFSTASFYFSNEWFFFLKKKSYRKPSTIFLKNPINTWIDT